MCVCNNLMYWYALFTSIIFGAILYFDVQNDVMMLNIVDIIILLLRHFITKQDVIIL